MSTFSKAISALFLAATGLAAQASVVLNAPSQQFNYDFTNGGDPRTGLCIGGASCGTSEYLYVQYPGSYVSNVIVSAHDGIGDKTNALLELWVNGYYHSRQDVKAAGSNLIFNVYRPVYQLQFRSVHKNGYSGGDETMLMNLQSF
jgi:hypothetical protein